jgi:hypothetical protein
MAGPDVAHSFSLLRACLSMAKLQKELHKAPQDFVQVIFFIGVHFF